MLICEDDDATNVESTKQHSTVLDIRKTGLQIGSVSGSAFVLLCKPSLKLLMNQHATKSIVIIFSVPITRLPKIKNELDLSQDLKAVLKEHDVFVMTLYGHVYIAVIQTSPQGPGFGFEVLLFYLSHDE
uniref:Uncharacterized protein n=1 Tax=Amphimedon queenslandica TaxID=400682 RepID=A0A1X7VVB7_AMPQE